MFKQRAFTSIFIVLIVLSVLMCEITSLQLVFLLGVVGICAAEWTALIAIKHFWCKVAYVAVGLSLAIGALWFMPHPFFSNLITAMLWAFIVIAVVSYPNSQKIWGKPWVVAILGWLLLPIFAYSLVSLFGYFEHGAFLILYTIVLVWAADVGAYICGKLWGKHKLIPKVSPGKSWEGAAGGLVLSLLTAMIAASFFHPKVWFLWISVAIILFGQSIFGDLFISMLKRRCNLKDTGTMLPGHGGFLDRLDSLIAVIPMALLLFSYLL